MITLELKEGRCKQCGKKCFTAPNDICLKCVAKNMKDGEYNHLVKKSVANKALDHDGKKPQVS